MGSPQISGPSWLVVNCSSPGPSNTIPGSLKPDSRDPETETGSLEIEKRVHRIHGTLETGLHMILRSLVAPTRGGRRISKFQIPFCQFQCFQMSGSQIKNQISHIDFSLFVVLKLSKFQCVQSPGIQKHRPSNKFRISDSQI